ncbi:MAG TPA: IS110 family transposase, partial [Acidimicrobiia bacterium]|nr:IS110 family transposase [Acidimicrobiia bacterium]
MAEAYETRVRSLRRLIKLYDTEIGKLDARIASEFKGHPGYEAIQAIHGVGPVLGAVFTAELGDVSR